MALGFCFSDMWDLKIIFEAAVHNFYSRLSSMYRNVSIPLYDFCKYPRQYRLKTGSIYRNII